MRMVIISVTPLVLPYEDFLLAALLLETQTLGRVERTEMMAWFCKGKIPNNRVNPF